MYRLSWIKYSNSRRWAYTHKSVCAAIEELGLTVQVAEPATMVAFVILEGTDREVIELRRIVQNRLNRIARNFPARFDKIS